MGWMGRQLPGLTKMIVDLGTGPDGETWAIGRIMGWLLFVVGTPFPVGMAAYVAWKGPAPTIDQWGAFLGPSAAYEGALIAAVTALIRLTNPTEPPAGS